MFRVLFSACWRWFHALKARFVVACLLLPCTVIVSQAWATELEINQSVVRVPEQALLAQLGKVIDPQSELSAVQLGQPLTLQSLSKQWLTQTKLSQVLSQQLGQSIQVTGVDKVWLEVCKPLDMGMVKRRLADSLQLNYGAENARLINVKNLTRSLCLPADVRHIKVNPDHLLKPRQQVMVSMVTGKQTPVWLDVEIEFAVAKLNSVKEANKAVTSADVEWYWLPNNQINSGQLYGVKQHLPARLFSKKTLSPGTVITSQNTFIKPLVGRGETVKVIYQTGAVKVEYRGKALSDGNQGEAVKVMFDQARTPVLGNVISEGVVGV